MSHTTSLVPVSKQDALRAAESLVEVIRLKRADLKESLIQEAMGGWQLKLCLTFPFVRHFTRAEAEYWVESADDLDYWARWRFTWSVQARWAQTVISAANLTQDNYVWLNLEEAHELREWL